MNTSAKSLEELVRELSPDLKSEVRAYIESLVGRQEGATKIIKLRQDWAGALRKHR